MRALRAVVLVLLLAVAAETACRLFWSLTTAVPFLGTDEILFVYYPELEPALRLPEDPGPRAGRMLFLGGSVLTSLYGDIPRQTLVELSRPHRKPMAAVNLARPAHTSRDSLIKYRALSGHRFDLVVFYHGINDVRANNVSDEAFEADYTHYAWYEQVEALLRHPEVAWWATPYTLEHLWIAVVQRLGLRTYLPDGALSEEALAHGDTIKTEAAFEENVFQLVEAAADKAEPLFLVTYAFHLPEDYDRSRFEGESAVVSATGEQLSFPAEHWGRPEHVIRGIEAHNGVLRGWAGLRHGVHVLDMERRIPKESKYFLDICHLTPLGAGLFAERLAAFLHPGDDT